MFPERHGPKLRSPLTGHPRPLAHVPVAPPTGLSAPRLLDLVRTALQTRHYSRKTEKAYVGWIRRFIVFHGTRHPRDMGAAEVTQYLSTLATAGHVALGRVFFDRGVVEALRLRHQAAPIPERDHPFSWVEHVHSELLRWYRSCGYTRCEVPRLPVAARAEFVLRALAHGAA